MRAAGENPTGQDGDAGHREISCTFMDVVREVVVI
jgi:hypothetical protein